MATPADRGWGSPGLRHGDTKAREYGRRHIVTIETPDGSRFSVRKEVAPIFLGFLNEILERGYRIKGGVLDDWGWYVRPIAGTNTPSNHSWGLAIDVNALTNPQGKKLTTDMPAFVPEAAKRWGLRWGGTYRKNPDAMHFEVVGSRDEVLRFIEQMKTLNQAGVSLPKATKEDDVPLGIDQNDDRRAQIREWFIRYLGRGFTSVDEQNLHLYVFGTKGADVCLAGILDSKEFDSDEAVARRKKLGL